MKKSFLAIVAAIVTLCTFGSSYAFAIDLETWVNTDAESDYGKRFSAYMDDEFDKNSFFISHIMYDWDDLAKQLENQTGYSDWRYTNIETIIKSCETSNINISTTSEKELNMAMGIDVYELSNNLFGVVSLYGLLNNQISGVVTDNDRFTIDKDIPYTFTENGYNMFVPERILGFQVLNPDNLEPGTQITVSYTANNCFVRINPNEYEVDLNVGSVTYTFTGTEWVTATDAGYYLVGDTQYGVMRFLFNVETSETIKESGIKYITSADITSPVDAKGVSGTGNAFYGDVTGIPMDSSQTYYAVAYIKNTDGEYFWSEPVQCSTDFDREIADYGGASE